MLQFLLSPFQKDLPRPRPPAPLPESLEGPLPPMRILDVEGMIRQASTRVSVDQLVKKGKKYINLLSHEKIDELINRAVKTIVDKHRVTAAYSHAASARQIETESTAEFQELLRQVQVAADATRAVDRSRETLEEELLEIPVELEPEQAPVEDRSSRNAFEDFVGELDGHVVRMFKIRALLLGRSDSPEAVAELGRVEEVLRTLLAKLVQAEGARWAASTEDARNLATLQKRMEKLYAHIAAMETALTTLSAAKTFSNQQLQNLLRDLGLGREDKNFEKKREMLKVLLDANQGIRKMSRELSERGITLDAPEEKAVFTPAGNSPSDVFSRSSA